MGGSSTGLYPATGRPVIFADLRAIQGLDLPDIYPDHGIVSTANVVIGCDRGRP
jgi:hypothetical protein